MRIVKREKFGVILADPPWKYRNFSSAMYGAADAHYDGMSGEDLGAIPVGSWAEKHACLLLWATWPKLDEAMRVLQAWGFDYVTGIPWVKTSPSSGEIRRGVGFWAMSASEILLIARKGSPRRRGINGPGGGIRNNAIGLLVDDQRVFYAPRGRHSAKPLEVQAWIERFVEGPYLELFARRNRSGWTCWGDELGWKLSAKGVEAAPRKLLITPRVRPRFARLRPQETRGLGLL